MTIPRLTFLLLAACGPALAQTSQIPDLAIDGKLQVSLVTAVQMEKKLGQLLLVNVDGFGVTGPLAVSKDYLDMVGSLQVGGVLPHYGRCPPTLLRDTNAALAAQTGHPLLIAADIVTLCLPDGSRVSFGDGYVGGFIGKHRGLDDEGFERLALLNAYVLWWLGMDWLLGPTVDTSTGDSRVATRARTVAEQMRSVGLLTTLKHWPFLPEDVDLHRQAVDSAIAPAEVERRAAVFRDLADTTDALMTTHVYDSLVDDRIVTLSPRWLEILSATTGWSGPVLSDGLFMLRSHRRYALADTPLPGLSRSGDDEIADWAARSILAGHDMVIVEGSAAITRWVYRRLLELACRADETGKALRERISAAHRKILILKARRSLSEGSTPPANDDLVKRVVAYLAARGERGPGTDAAADALMSEVREVSARTMLRMLR